MTNQKSFNQLLKKAARLVVLHQNARSSFLQRELDIGYQIAGEILNELEAMGVISEFRGIEPRMIYFEYVGSLKGNLPLPLAGQLTLKRKKKDNTSSIFLPLNTDSRGSLPDLSKLV